MARMIAHMFYFQQGRGDALTSVSGTDEMTYGGRARNPHADSWRGEVIGLLQRATESQTDSKSDRRVRQCQITMNIILCNVIFLNPCSDYKCYVEYVAFHIDCLHKIHLHLIWARDTAFEHSVGVNWMVRILRRIHMQPDFWCEKLR